MNFKRKENLKNCRILISNDDGIDAPGIKVLEEEICKICDDVWVVAPQDQKSGASHSVSPGLSNLEGIPENDKLPTGIRKIDNRHFSVSGTPADCVYCAVNFIIKDKLPDLVVTGINCGRNVAEDVGYSGTVGAAAEGIVLGIPAVAFSQHLEKGTTDREIARHYPAQPLEKLTSLAFSRNTLVSVNFPNISLAALKGIDVSRQGEWRFEEDPQEFELSGKDNYDDELLPKFDIPSDIESWKNNKISVTPLKLDMTDYTSIAPLSKVLNDLAGKVPAIIRGPAAIC